ncbi:MAG: hypothetical protein A2X94_09285 [Bdellovibrionales bacterium GWB1_55_8]|nr:MAG: hypothetical protein A2X94_09285 [Bdellovibrionales bacterium GWB1_55_8]
MILLVSGLLGGLGLACIVLRRTLLGILVGVQLLILGATMMFVLSGISSGARPEGHLFGFFIVLGAVAQLAAGYALAIRRFYLRGQIDMDELRTLKR